ncbi:MAG: Rpn family recombination-promoting nuclease/putative transposase, partial [Bdellovibrionales bacterium]|nr:Rpn family recombination-promoting nuclease/putative transposase [Bdellovibrionales bacterium]
MAIYTNHHDQFFKFFFSKPELAQELLELIFSEEELETYDLTKLRAEQDSFPDGSNADLVFSLPLKPYQTRGVISPASTPLTFKEKMKKHSNSNLKSEVRIFILLEHKASYNVSLFEQLFRYQYLLMEQSLKEGKALIPIIPVVF